jgi:hypothetical protein
MRAVTPLAGASATLASDGRRPWSDDYAPVDETSGPAHLGNMPSLRQRIRTGARLVRQRMLYDKNDYKLS